MKEWWNNLGLREKQLLSLGGIFLILFLLYEIIWSPISTHNASLRSDIAHNQKLLIWMEEADGHIQSLQKMLQTTTSTMSSAALLSLLQKEVNQSPFANNLQQLNQAENNAVRITFQKINFDALITWLTAIWKKDNLTVKQITVAPNGSAGIVDVTIVLS
jgi:type II secretory pathway component PulM